MKLSRGTKSAIFLWLAVFTIGIAVAQSNDSSRASNDKSIYAEFSKAPPKAESRRNPLESDPEAVAAGAKLFQLHCAECHGADADGGKKGPSLRAPEVQQVTPGTLFWVLTNGVVRKGMPVWSRLPEPQRWQLVSYIKSLSATPKSATAQ
jgi:mono/diheme cytochrome c family protein